MSTDTRYMRRDAISPKSYGIAVCLAGIFGVLGIHHFYLGRTLYGLFDLGLTVAAVYFLLTDQVLAAAAFFAVDIVHSLVETIRLLVGASRDGNGAIVAYPGQFDKR